MNKKTPSKSKAVVSKHEAHRHVPRSSETKPNVVQQTALSALRQWWKIAIPTGLLLAAAAAAGVYYSATPLYRAKHAVRIAERAPYIVFPGGRDSTSRRFIATQQQLLRSSLVMGPVVSNPDIIELAEVAEMNDPIRQLGEKVSFKSRGNSDLYDIGYIGPDAKNAALIVNAIVDAFFKLRDEHEAQRSSGIIEQLEIERQSHDLKVGRLQNNVRAMLMKLPNAGQQSQTSGNMVSSPVAILQQKLTEQEADHAMLRAQLKSLEQLGQANPIQIDDAEIESVLHENEEILALKAKIAATKKGVNDLMSKLVAPNQDDHYLQLLAELESHDKLLTKRLAELRDDIPGELLRNRELTRAIQIEDAQRRLDVLATLNKVLKEQLEEEIVRKTEINLENLELEFKKSEMSRALGVFTMIAQRIETIKTEQRAPARIVSLLPANPPTVPLEAYPVKQMTLAGMVAFCLPFCLAVAWEWRTQRLNTADQLSALSGVPVIGEIAFFPAPRTTGKALSRRLSRALRNFEESVHNLRTYLVLSEPLEGMKVLATASSSTNEGKTSVATQLALSYSRSGGRVLLIDGDMRSPDIHTIFDIDRGPGLAEYFEGETTLEEAIHRDWSENLHILPSGRLSTEPHRLVSNASMERLLGELRDKYTMIIIDTPPVLAASESLVMSRAADATLLCTMRDTSRLAQVRATHNRLVDAGAHPVGAVFNGVPVSQYDNLYGHYDYTSSQ